MPHRLRRPGLEAIHGLTLLALLLAACRPNATSAPPTHEATPTADSTPALAGATPKAPTPTSATGSTRTAEIEEIQGQAEARDDAQAAWKKAALGQTLATGHQLRKLTESRATLRFSDSIPARKIRMGMGLATRATSASPPSLIYYACFVKG